MKAIEVPQAWKKAGPTSFFLAGPTVAQMVENVTCGTAAGTPMGLPRESCGGNGAHWISTP